VKPVGPERRDETDYDDGEAFAKAKISSTR
jgi:hypothetical protein